MTEHKPVAGRRAYICEHKDHQGIPYRTFAAPGDPEPQCSRHGKMKRQENHPYMGQQIPESNG